MKTKALLMSTVLLVTAGSSAYGQRYVRAGEPGSEHGRSAASERYVYGSGGSTGGGFSWSPPSSENSTIGTTATPAASSLPAGAASGTTDSMSDPPKSSSPTTPGESTAPPTTTAAAEKSRTSFFEKLHGRTLNEQESFAALGAVLNDPALLTVLTTDPVLWREFSDSLDPKIRETLSDIPGIGQTMDALDDRSDRLPLPSADSLPNLGNLKPF